MAPVLVFHRRDIRFAEPDAGTGDEGGGLYALARLIGPGISDSLGAGLAQFHACSIRWTLLYDEVLVVLKGTFRLRHGKDLADTVVATAGEVIWIPAGTDVAYEGENAEVFFAVHPGNWRTLNGMAEI